MEMMIVMAIEKQSNRKLNKNYTQLLF